MNVLIEYLCAQTNSEVPSQPPPLKAFMDDLFLMSPDVSTSQVLLNRWVLALDWARMEFRTSKSRSMVIEQGKIINFCPFKVQTKDSNSCEFVPSIHANPIKFLGRVITASLSDSEKIESVASS